jgi:hypothetical protein
MRARLVAKGVVSAPYVATTLAAAALGQAQIPEAAPAALLSSMTAMMCSKIAFTRLIRCCDGAARNPIVLNASAFNARRRAPHWGLLGSPQGDVSVLVGAYLSDDAKAVANTSGVYDTEQRQLSSG